MTSPPRLVVRHGPNPNEEFTLPMKTSIVGREPINDVVFSDPEVSRRHARIILQLDHYYIEDLGSTNGTFVNGRRIDKVTRLSNGDIIDLGETIRLTFIVEEEDVVTAGHPPGGLQISQPETAEAGNGPLPVAAAGVSLSAQNTLDPEQSQAAPDVDNAPSQEKSRQMTYLGIGCAALLTLACGCGTVAWLLNTYAPNFLSGLFQ